MTTSFFFEKEAIAYHVDTNPNNGANIFRYDDHYKIVYFLQNCFRLYDYVLKFEKKIDNLEDFFFGLKRLYLEKNIWHTLPKADNANLITKINQAKNWLEKNNMYPQP